MDMKNLCVDKNIVFLILFNVLGIIDIQTEILDGRNVELMLALHEGTVEQTVFAC